MELYLFVRRMSITVVAIKIITKAVMKEIMKVINAPLKDIILFISLYQRKDYINDNIFYTKSQKIGFYCMNLKDMIYYKV